MSENNALLPKSGDITPEYHIKTALHDALMIEYNKMTAEYDEKSAGSKIVINCLTIRFL